MKTYYSIISYRSNIITDEKISIGLIMFNEELIITNFSASKLRIVKRLFPQSDKLLKYVVERIKTSFVTKRQSSFLNKKVDVEFLNYLQQYENELLSFTSPKVLLENLNERTFTMCFSKWIEGTLIIETKKIKESGKFQAKIEQLLIKPLSDKVNINYTVETKKVPGLVNDYTVNTIGLNGSIYASNALDVNLQNFNYRLYEFESFLDASIPFLEEKFKVKHEKNNIVLFVNDPKKDSIQEEKYHKLMERNNVSYFNNYSVRTIEKVPEFIKNVKKSGARKLTELFDEVES